MPLVGAESSSATLDATKRVHRMPFRRAAKSDALDATLQELVEVWPRLDEPVRAAISLMIRVANPRL